jgi:hypothetical protein
MWRQLAVNKIFGIGLPKTGSRSLAEFLSRLGYNTIHDGSMISPSFGALEPEPIMAEKKEEGRFYSTLSLNEELGEEWDCLINRYQSYYDFFDEAYPDSKFILTTRPFEDWYRSFAYHLNRHHQRDLLRPSGERGSFSFKPLSSEVYFFDLFGVVSFCQLVDPKFREYLERRTRRHSFQIEQYFNAKYGEDVSSHLLLLDVTLSNKEKAGKVLSFLDRDDDASYPHFFMNTTPREKDYTP